MMKLGVACHVIELGTLELLDAKGCIRTGVAVERVEKGVVYGNKVAEAAT